ncbi:class D sortase [Salipaludibacillus agaradhaerens]|uniref:class D sortase n=1 Tax=Salipaludibacillus agaradhaerens TaxID=76935 RepID=UPI002150EAFF|nr:class D sortase [Salipaludibacillus agaradhaerens]MCR6106004.1 class D sortase [Salipaludibacillus agaradhaerens]MCR6118037.1 class D sortase [Salipaludibacillus agaradhaerens]
MNQKRLIAVGFFLILTGFWVFTTNGYTLLKGYWLYKTAVPFETSIISENNNTLPSKTEWKTNTELYSVPPSIGDEIGVLTIPKIDAQLPIFHGTDEDELEKGVGHYSNSVLPGEQDNTVLAGHRDTVFRHLGEVGKGDLLIVTTSAGEFTYKVYNVRIVDSDDRTVIVPRPRATLTVSTCYPFQFIGHASERYILEANLIKSNVN